MSLRIDTKKCQPAEPKDQADAVLLQTLAYTTMIVMLGEITEANYIEFYARAHLVETEDGALRVSGNGGVFFTVEEIKRWIGLKANVATESRAAFVKRRSKAIQEKIQRTIAETKG